MGSFEQIFQFLGKDEGQMGQDLVSTERVRALVFVLYRKM
jgi:hypothetical protein